MNSIFNILFVSLILSMTTALHDFTHNLPDFAEYKPLLYASSRKYGLRTCTLKINDNLNLRFVFTYGNDGKYYNKATGVFTAPDNEYYSFRLVLAASCPKESQVKLGLMKNSTVLDDISIGSKFKVWTLTTLQKLQQGDAITIKLLDDYRFDDCNIELVKFIIGLGSE